MADWDAINIMNSDRAQNLIEFCQIEDAYRGFHFHFANVAVVDSVLRNNYRGIQFQESIVEVRGTDLYRNKSGIQARDSEISFTGNTVSRNIVGMNVLRNTITLKDNYFANNAEEGLRSREGLPLFERNRVVGNRYGVMITGGLYGTYSGNVISQNLEGGIALKGTDAIEISRNVIQTNGLNGLNLQDSAAVVRSNLISDNGERGIGVLSFQGVITQNVVTANGRYNLGIDAEGDVAAPMNWWGGEDLATTIYDKEDDPARGRAAIQPVRDEPIEFSWPTETIDVDAVWHGDIVVEKSLQVTPGTELLVYPGTRVLFARGAGMSVKGRIIAKGTKDKRILFSSLHAGGPAAWDEVLLDHAEGSAFSSCGFEHGTWALHVHFTKLAIEDCSFVENQGGLRFTSGPIEVTDSFFGGNEVGIRSFRGTAHVSRNIISGNGIGIFVREKGSGLRIRENNFSGNREYDIRIGDFNDEDVDARENWWDGRNPAGSIYDERNEPGIGNVVYEPYARSPFSLDAAAGALDASRSGRVKPMQNRGGQ